MSIDILEVIETETAAKNADTVRKLNNFIKNLRRDYRKQEGIMKDPTSTQYKVRRARAEKIAIGKVVKRLENLVA